MPTYQVVTPVGVRTRPCPETLPEPGQTFTVQRPFITGGGHTYRTGQSLTILERTTEAPYGYASSLGNWKVRCPYRESVWSGIEEMIANRTIAPEAPSDQTGAEVLEGIRSILSAYHEELGISTKGNLVAQVSELVRSHRSIRDNFRSIYGEYQDARKQGYEVGVKMGGKAADSHYIALSSLKVMTLREISNLLHDIE